jgi:hypothetical protein
MPSTNRIKKGPATPWHPAIVLLAIVPIASAGWAIVQYIVPRFQEVRIPAAGPALSQDAQAAIAGVAAFYTIDYTEPVGAWAERMCALVVTPDDCLLLQLYFAPAIRATAEKYRVQSTCTVLPVGLFSIDETILSRIWILQVTVSNPWPGINPTETVFAEVVFDQDRQEWRFRRILFEQELPGYRSPTPKGP